MSELSLAACILTLPVALTFLLLAWVWMLIADDFASGFLTAVCTGLPALPLALWLVSLGTLSFSGFMISGILGGMASHLLVSRARLATPNFGWLGSLGASAVWGLAANLGALIALSSLIWPPPPFG